MAASLPGAAVSLAVIGSPASFDSLTASGESFCRLRLLLRRGGGVDARVIAACRTAAVSSWKCSPGSLPVRAVISAASRSMIRPSLSVVHTVPSRRRKLAPALSSPPKQQEPSNSPGDKPLEAHRNLAQLAAQPLHHAIDHAAADQRLADRRAVPATAADVSADTESPRPDNDWDSSARPKA